MPWVSNISRVEVNDRSHEDLWDDDTNASRNGDPGKDVDQSARVALTRFVRFISSHMLHSIVLNSPKLLRMILAREWKSNDIYIQISRCSGICMMIVNDLLASSRRVRTCKLSKSTDDASVHRKDHNKAI